MLTYKIYTTLATYHIAGNNYNILRAYDNN